MIFGGFPLLVLLCQWVFMGIVLFIIVYLFSSVLPFIQYFLENISSVQDASILKKIIFGIYILNFLALMSSLVIAVIVFVSIPSAIIGGWISGNLISSYLFFKYNKR